MTSSASGVGRREMFRIGAATVTFGALVAACGESGGGEVGRVGEAPKADELPEATTNDGVLMRTSSSMHHSIAGVYELVIPDRELLSAEHVELAERLLERHIADAATYEELTADVGSVPWPCGNPKFDSSVVKPVLDRIIIGEPATEALPAIPPSDDPQRDILNFLHGLETIAAAMAQSFVLLLSSPELRGAITEVGAAVARQAATVALTIDPTAYVSTATEELVTAEPDTTAPTTTVQDIAQEAAPTTTTPPDSEDSGPTLTEIPPVAALPAFFGQLGPLPLVVGAGDENGVRMKVNLETPAQNSYIYDYMEPAC